MQVCTSLQTDDHTITPPLSFLQAGCSYCHPINSTKSTEGSHCSHFALGNPKKSFFVAFLQMLVALGLTLMALKRTGCDVWQLECQASSITASVQSKICGYSSSQCTLPLCCSNSHAIWDHTVLPATQQR